jgi:tetratricopeptide (TPR) repeat protein
MPRRIVLRALSLLTGATLALMAGGLLETGARMMEAARPTVLRASRATGELRTPFFVQDGSSLTIHPDYTGGSRCYPFHCQSLPIAKSPREYRIGCFGESTTNGIDLLRRTDGRGIDFRRETWDAGRPYCEQLRDALQALWPTRIVTSYNLGGDATDSAEHLPILREASRRLSFDLWVMYAGHNEFLAAPDLVEPYASGALQRLAVLATRRLALMRLLRGKGYTRDDYDGMGRIRHYSDQLFTRTSVFADVRQRVLERYEHNLREMAQLARARGTTLVLIEPISNHDRLDKADLLFNCFRHDISKAEVARIWQDYQRGLQHEAAGRYQAAIDAFREAQSLDPGYQPAAVGIARCYLALGDRRRSLRQAYLATEANALPAVAIAQVVETVRWVCRETRTPLARTVQTCDDIYLNDPDRYRRIFVDECHPSAEGHAILVRAILDALREHHVLSVQEARSAR